MSKAAMNLLYNTYLLVDILIHFSLVYPVAYLEYWTLGINDDKKNNTENDILILLHFMYMSSHQ